jgi:type II secretion system protein C
MFVVGSSYLLAHSVNAWVAVSLLPPIESTMAMEIAGRIETDQGGRQEASRQYAQDILASGLFVMPPPPSSTARHPSAAAALPPMNVSAKLVLIGVVTGGDGSDRAILEEVATKKQALYRVAQRVADIGEIAAIEKQRVLLREGPREEWLELAIVKQTAEASRFPLATSQVAVGVPAPVSQAAQTPGRRSIDRAQLAQLVASPENYMTEARFQPHFNATGQLDGFLVDGIRQVGVLQRAGLQNHDVLAGINGIEVRDPGRLWEVFKQLQHERVVRLNVMRESQPMTWVVEVKG